MQQVCITGGAKRLGREIALMFARKGYDVAIHYNLSRDEALNTVSELESLGVHAKAYQADLSDVEASQKMFQAVLKDFPSLSVQVHSASLFEKMSLSECTSTALLEHYTIHVVTPLMMMQEFVKQRESGVIISMLDTKITTNEYERAPYLLAKKALAALTRMGALEFAPAFRVNGIAPGYVLDPSDSTNSFQARMNPLQRQNDVQSILDTILFLIENRDITGQIISIDGGARL